MSIPTECFTCTKLIQQDVPVVVRDCEKVQDALAKHFWFAEDESKAAVLCQQCWGKIDEFHKFYCEVERVHTRQLQPIQWLNVKEEPLERVDALSTSSTEDVKNDDEASLESDSEQNSKEKQTDDPVNDGPRIRKRKISQRGRKRTSTGNPLGRPSQSWQKELKDEDFISQNINLECDTCATKCSSFQDLQRHSLTKHDKRAYVFCCGLKFCRRPRLVDHIQFHLNPEQFRCGVCSKQFQNTEALQWHKDKVHAADEDKTFQCSMCPKTYSRKRFLTIHEKYHRMSVQKKWHCSSCDRYFLYESILKEHQRKVHQKEFKYVCHVCAKGFQILGVYTKHVASHDENAVVEKAPKERVQCLDCGAWVNKSSLRTHKLGHSSGQQSCKYCGQECKSVLTLKYHEAQHRRGDLSCSVCGKTFKRGITLKEHMASHTGEVLYNCDFCDRTFNSNANRASHRKKMHPREWLEDKLKKNPGLLLEHQPQLPQ
ncbi:transcription factor grauzone-like [Topomyia yanbarensis]|uniref:transcription factor grauzone-like n=1 Tax=Topomyia yanbarensis TaxID=2498891 RepID=UPI00273BFB9D|nr:transcription factor grauzone-like [Topomyia yanbarensis]XP_058833776.1 transcription factor grauzone-like [Topomyia yanbarensis]